MEVIIRICDGTCRNGFLSLEPLTDSTANGIADKMVDVLKENNIPLASMVGFTSDNCPVTMGAINGVQAKLKLLIPNLFVNGCICHILNLVSCAALSCLSEDVDKFMRATNFYFWNSPKRKEVLFELQQYFGAEIHVILRYASTRWMSRMVVIDRVLEQLEPLKYCFTLSDFESAQNAEKVEFIATELLNSKMKMYFLFFTYILKIINNINLEMQSQEVRIHILLPRMKFLLMQVARNFLK